MSKKFLLIGLITVLFASVATAAVILFLFPYEPKRPPKADDTGWTKEGIQEVVKANNKFALDLYTELDKTEQGNIFYSPYSIFAALAITYEGAKGQTAEEIKSVFHFPESEILRQNFAAIYNKINEGAVKDYELRTGNALWVQQDFPLLPDYTDRVERYYGGKAVNVDFIRALEQSRQTINRFIKEQTNNKIKDLIPPEVLDALTRLVITNAIYFKGTWEWQFDKDKTQEEDFKITPDNIVKVPMMYMDRGEIKFNYADTGDLQILELPYRGDKISMLILLPTENLNAIEPLTAEKLSEYKNRMEKTELDAIYLPKFKFETKYFMKDILSAMGMPTAFTEKADFSGIERKRKLYIDQVIHQAFINVDEKGTEAAAATGVIIGELAIAPRIVFKANRPFIFLIQDKGTGNILFLGRVVDPTK